MSIEMVDKEDIEKVLNDIFHEYGLETKCSIIKSSPYYEQALEMSEKYGLKLKKCTRDQLRFEDLNHHNPLNEDITSTEIRFDGMLNSDKIDFTNSTDSKYTMENILGTYDAMPEELKNRTGIIAFEDMDWSPHSAIYLPQYRKENAIVITNEAYTDEETMQMGRIMAHEMGHCFEFGKLNDDEKACVRRMLNENVAEGDMEIWMNGIYPKSHLYSMEGGVFADAVHSDASSRGVDELSVITSDYAKVHYLEHQNKPGGQYHMFGEDFADTVSMVATPNRSEAKVDSTRGDILDMLFGEPETIGFDEFKANQPKSVAVVEDLLKVNR